MKLIQTKKKWFFVQKIETSERIFSGENDKNHILPGCSELIIWCCISVINVLVKHHIQNQQTWLCLTQKTWRWRSNCLRCLRWILEYLKFWYLDFLILPEVNIGVMFWIFSMNCSGESRTYHEQILKRNSLENKKPTHRRDRNIKRCRDEWSLLQ